MSYFNKRRRRWRNAMALPDNLLLSDEGTIYGGSTYGQQSYYMDPFVTPVIAPVIEEPSFIDKVIDDIIQIVAPAPLKVAEPVNIYPVTNEPIFSNPVYTKEPTHITLVDEPVFVSPVLTKEPTFVASAYDDILQSGNPTPRGVVTEEVGTMILPYNPVVAPVVKEEPTFISSVIDNIVQAVTSTTAVKPEPVKINDMMLAPAAPPVMDEPSFIGSMIDSIVAAVIPTQSTMPEPQKTYTIQGMPVLDPIEQLYIPPVPNYVQPEPQQILEPVSYPGVTYSDPVLQIQTDEILAPVVTTPETQKTTVDKVVDKVTNVIDNITGNNKAAPGTKDNSILYLAMGVAAIGVLALIFKK